jgi:hypothetical protein
MKKHDHKALILALSTILVLFSLLFIPSENNSITGNVIQEDLNCKTISLSYENTRRAPYENAEVCLDQNGEIYSITVLNSIPKPTTTTTPREPRERPIRTRN